MNNFSQGSQAVSGAGCIAVMFSTKKHTCYYGYLLMLHQNRNEVSNLNMHVLNISFACWHALCLVCSPDNGHTGWVILVLVDSHHKHGGIRWWGGHNHALGATLDVSLWGTNCRKFQYYNNIWCYICTFQIVQRCKLTEAFSMLRKTPVDSTTYRAPASPHGISAGFMLSANKREN